MGYFVHIIDRETARRLGMKRYFTGEPCKHGHVSERSVYSTWCDECNRLSREKNKEKNKERADKYRREKREKSRKSVMDWHRRNKAWLRNYRLKWKEKNRESQNKKALDRYYLDPSLRMRYKMRNMQSRMLKNSGGNKTESCIPYFGYSSEELKNSLESKFSSGMTWDNYGDWHIDHKYPMSRYMEEGVYDPKIINSLENLVPMWAFDNISKGPKTLKEWLGEKGRGSVEWKLYSKFL